MNWFYLGRGAAVRGNNARYLHTGRISEGCVTVEPAAAHGLEEQLALLKRTVDGYGSALAADDVLRELTRDQRAELVQRRDCAERFVKERKSSPPCQPLQWLGLKT